MVLLWQRMGEVFGLNRWAQERGAVDGDQFQVWLEGLKSHSQEQIARGVGNCHFWQSNELPDLSNFSRLCLTEVRQPTPKEQQLPFVSSGVRERELERQNRIRFGPDSRYPSPRDVETFEQSYHNCGLGKRWPGGDLQL